MKHKSLFVVLTFVLFIGFIQSCKMEEIKNETTLFVGTYTNTGSEGIYTYTFDPDTGKLLDKKLAATITNPSFLALSPDKNTLYAVGEVDDYIENSGSITTFRVTDSLLRKIDTKPTYGADPCFVGVDSNGDYVVVANYTGGNIAIFNTNSAGDLQPSPQIIDHKVVDSSKTSHAHMALFVDSELFVADLGLDRIKKYTLGKDGFSPSQRSELVVAEGAGPRHFVTSQNGKFLYAINELNSTITMFHKEKDSYSMVKTYGTLASDFEGKSFCADIHISQDGRFLYGSNRGENTIVIFEIEDSTGKLKLIGREPVKGDWPRNFSIDPTGAFLLVANERSNNIVVFSRDAEKGTLSFTSEVELASPVCLQFY